MRIPSRIPSRASRDQNPRTEDIPSLKTKKDRAGETWVFWNEFHGELTTICLGQLKDNDIINIQNVSSGFMGINHSPDLDFSSNNHPVMTWINIYDGSDSVIVRDICTGQSWQPVISNSLSLFSPKILVGQNDLMWLIWVGPHENLDEIFFSIFDGYLWNNASPLSLNPSVPDFHPVVGIDSSGHPWVAWSAYDGEDYEIFITSWEGNSWRPHEKVTENSNSADAQPSILLYEGTLPMIVWTHSLGGNRDIFLSYRAWDYWIPGINISRDDDWNDSPIILSENGQIAISWSTLEDSFLEIHSFESLELLRKNGDNRPDTVPVISPLDRNSFIAFGDSITFGSTSGPGQGEGYPIHLDVLLNQIFENPTIYNRGVPGEDTWDGVSRIGTVITTDLALYILLMEGTNDVSFTSYSTETTIFNIREMISRCLNFGAYPLLSTIIPQAFPRWQDPVIGRTLDVNRAIREIAKEFNIPLVNNYKAFMDYPESKGGYETLISDDNLHPNVEGYQHMAETWYSRIKVIPFPPVNIEAKKMRRQGAVVLNWEENPMIIPGTQIQRYKIYRKIGTAPKYSFAGTVSAPSFSFSDIYAPMNEDLLYILSAANADDVEGPASDPVPVVIGDPYAPSNVKVQTVTNKALLYHEYINIITWEANPANQGLFSITKYRIYRKKKTEDDNRFQLIQEVDAQVFEIMERQFSSQNDAGQYAYGIAAVDTNGIEGLIGTAVTSNPSPR